MLKGISSSLVCICLGEKIVVDDKIRDLFEGCFDTANILERGRLCKVEAPVPMFVHQQSLVLRCR